MTGIFGTPFASSRQRSLSHATTTVAGDVLLYSGLSCESLRSAMAVTPRALVLPTTRHGPRPSHEPTDIVTRPLAPSGRMNCPQVGIWAVGAAQFESVRLNELCGLAFLVTAE